MKKTLTLSFLLIALSARSFAQPVTIPTQITSPNVAAFYRDCYYAGGSVSLPSGKYKLSELIAKGIRNDDISSIEIASGYNVTVCAEDNFMSSYRRYSNNVSCLVPLSFNDVITSLIISKNGEEPSMTGAATFYKECNYSGKAVSLPTGSYLLKDLIRYGIQNDDISSLRLEKGHALVLYRDDNFSSAYMISTGDKSCLTANSFDNVTTSLVIQEAVIDRKLSASLSSETRGSDKLNIYPNPAQNSFTIANLKSKSTVVIYNATGQVVNTFKTANAAEPVNIATLAKGLYQVTVTDANNEVSSFRLIKN